MEPLGPASPVANRLPNKNERGCFLIFGISQRETAEIPSVSAATVNADVQNQTVLDAPGGGTIKIIRERVRTPWKNRSALFTCFALPASGSKL
jgi:hypothetical protein